MSWVPANGTGQAVAASCNTSPSQSFNIGTGSHELSGCPAENLYIGHFQFPWTNYVTSNYSTATYTGVQVASGSVSNGAWAWYGPLYIYQDKSSGTTKEFFDFECHGVRYTNMSIAPNLTLGFGSTDITAEQYVWMTGSGTCGAQAEGTPEFTIYN